MDFDALNNQISPLDTHAIDRAQARWNSIAKPIGSLGKLETVVARLAGMSGAEPNIDKRAVVVFCADNGVVAEGVASTHAEITAVMAEFIAKRRSAVCIMAKKANTDVIAADIGMSRESRVEGLRNCRVAAGTENMANGPAMTKDQAMQAIKAGIDLAADCKQQGYQILATGEMGIGNTTTSSAVASVLLGCAAQEMTGRGAGLSDSALANKIEVIDRSIERNAPDPNDALDTLAKLGGFDIAGLCGIFIGGALSGIPVVVDGVISGVAALVASRLCPACREYMIASHQSAEPAAGRILAELGLAPLIYGEMRLGEGTGAVAVLPLLDMALAVYRELMTFDEIGM